MAVPTGLKVLATVLGIGSQIQRGKAEKRAGEIEAKQMEKAAEQVLAVGTRRAGEAKREGEYVQSSAATAITAGSGAVSDPGAIKTMAEIKSAADYNALAAIYESESEAQKLREGARARRAGGSAAAMSSYIGAGATALKGASNIYDYYNPKKGE